ncbi:MAG: hypothetical protein QHG99_02395 [Methanomicrobiales archaeon]|nr:hypothetical protein [Methanomicrobiales archaeon]
MSAAGRAIAAAALVIWLCLVIFFMILSRTLDLEIFFVLFLIGILVIAELTDARYLVTREKGYMKYIIGGGVVIFGIIVASRVVEIIAS